MENALDTPKSLASPAERDARRIRLGEPHVAPLTAYVRQIREATGLGEQIPFFDPLDGGVAATCLYLLEAPGARAVLSGFISRNNPDESAKNFFELNREAGIPRHLTVTWNMPRQNPERPGLDFELRAFGLQGTVSRTVYVSLLENKRQDKLRILLISTATEYWLR